MSRRPFRSFWSSCTSKFTLAHSAIVAATWSWTTYLSTASVIASPIMPQMMPSTFRPSSTCWRVP
jgi:hypothetical protein